MARACCFCHRLLSPVAPTASAVVRAVLAHGDGTQVKGGEGLVFPKRVCCTVQSGSVGAATESRQGYFWSLRYHLVYSCRACSYKSESRQVGVWFAMIRWSAILVRTYLTEC